MARFDDNPTRIEVPAAYNRPELPIRELLPLPPPKWPDASFGSCLERRRSSDDFETVELGDLASWLFFTAGVQAVNSGDSNRQHRYVASFGALHPHHLLLRLPDERWITYLGDRHCAGLLDVNVETANSLREKALLHCRAPEATLVVLLANWDLVQTYYQRADGLLLRDAGVMLGHAQLVAAAFGLGFRILGGTGAPESHTLLASLRFTPASTGLALIGGMRPFTNTKA